MTWLWTVLGFGIILVGLFEVFQTLLHPTGRGRLSWLLVKTVWRISRHFNHKLGSLTGPISVIMIIGLWGIIQTLGWALIYYPHIPQGFAYSAGIPEGIYPDFAEAVYTSLVTIATLGYGEVIAIDPWIRIVSPLQALAGFALLTAAVSWFMQIYPALAQRRALGLRLCLLRQDDYAGHLQEVDAISGNQLVETLTAGIVQVRIHLMQNSETYCFRESNRDISLPANISYGIVCGRPWTSARFRRPATTAQ